MKPRNNVARHMKTFCHARTYRDRTKYSRTDDWLEEEDLDLAKSYDLDETDSLSPDEQGLLNMFY